MTSLKKLRLTTAKRLCCATCVLLALFILASCTGRIANPPAPTGQSTALPAGTGDASSPGQENHGHIEDPGQTVDPDGTEGPSDTGEPKGTEDATSGIPAENGTEGASGTAAENPSVTPDGGSGTASASPGNSGAASESTPGATPTPAPKPTATPTPTPAATALPQSYVFRTASGAGYTVSGATVSDPAAKFNVRNTFTMNFENGSFRTQFNRMVFTYSSGEPLHVDVKYELDGREQVDDFYLDAGENVTFRGLISSYLRSKSGVNIKSVAVNTCTGKATDFRLIDLKTETVKVYNSETYYLEGSRYIVGIKLSWGGGINFIQDKTCRISGLTNLINQADTGRLVQQSYYGTGGNSEYTPGDFNGSTWAYNPVQGGDKYGNSSRLIDIEIRTGSVYIKAQPQDWSLNNRLTRSYMENTYTVQDDLIRVDNRFTDYSGWTHRYAHQELPAFYTVSYLDTFTWYNGDKSWTDAPLAVRDNLQFWGDAQYAESCRFPVKVNNTETWCAWYNRGSNFGIGLYVPNIDVLYAGRFGYNGSKSASNGATNYVAPLNMLLMVSYKPIEYSYLITTGDVASIRKVFKDNRNFAANASLHDNYQSMRVVTVDYASIDFTVAGSEQVFGAVNSASYAYDNSRKCMQLKAVDSASDPWINIEYTRADEPLDAGDYKTITFEYMIPTANKHGGEYASDLFLCTGSRTGATGDARVRVPLIKDGKFHTATIDVSGLPFWDGTVNAIRFDFFDACEAGDCMYIKNFRLV